MNPLKQEASREEKCPRRMVVTPEQLKSGWVEFVRDGIPNTIKHDFKNPVKRRDGTYEVDEPQLGHKGSATEPTPQKGENNDTN